MYEDSSFVTGMKTALELRECLKLVKAKSEAGEVVMPEPLLRHIEHNRNHASGKKSASRAGSSSSPRSAQG